VVSGLGGDGEHIGVVPIESRRNSPLQKFQVSVAGRDSAEFAVPHAPNTQGTSKCKIYKNGAEASKPSKIVQITYYL